MTKDEAVKGWSVPGLLDYLDHLGHCEKCTVDELCEVGKKLEVAMNQKMRRASIGKSERAGRVKL